MIRLPVRCLPLSLVATCLVLVSSGCNPQKGAPSSGASPATSPAPVAAPETLAVARGGFVTKLKVRGPAPQSYQNQTPPPGVQVVEFQSGELRLKGWLSANPADGKR